MFRATNGVGGRITKKKKAQHHLEWVDCAVRKARTFFSENRKECGGWIECGVVL